MTDDFDPFDLTKPGEIKPQRLSPLAIIMMSIWGFVILFLLICGGR